MLPVLPIYAVSLELAFRSAVSLSVKDRSPRLAEIRAKHFRRFKLVTPVFYWGIGRCFFVFQSGYAKSGGTYVPPLFA